MECKDIRRLDSSYIDGELDREQTEAFRSHLQQCSACRQATRDLATMVDVASQLEPIEPPHRLWAAIRAELQTDIQDGVEVSARAHTGDERRTRATWFSAWLGGGLPSRWRFARVAPVAAVGALACVALIWSLASESRPKTREVAAPNASEPASESGVADGVANLAVKSRDGADTRLRAQAVRASDPGTHSETLTRELQDADRQYSQTIAELRGMVEEDRPTWPSATSAAYERRMKQFNAAADRHRQALAPVGGPSIQAEHRMPDPRGRDALYAVYRAEIAFLQQVAIDGPPALPGSEAYQ